MIMIMIIIHYLLCIILDLLPTLVGFACLEAGERDWQDGYSISMEDYCQLG